MAEALEKWPIDLFSRLLPRIYQIIQEIDRRFVEQVRAQYPGNEEKVKKMAILMDGQVKMHILRSLQAILSTVLQSCIQRS